MTFDELLEQYEQHKNILKANDNADHDFDQSVLKIQLEISDGFKGSATKKIEESSVKQMQRFYDRPIELKNATAGIKDYDQATILVEHHQHKRIENELVPSGILITKSGNQVFTIDRIGHFSFDLEFLKWCYEYNLSLKHPILKDQPIASQKGGNQGYAFTIHYRQLPFLILKYWEHLDKT